MFNILHWTRLGNIDIWRLKHRRIIGNRPGCHPKISESFAHVLRNRLPLSLMLGEGWQVEFANKFCAKDFMSHDCVVFPNVTNETVNAGVTWCYWYHNCITLQYVIIPAIPLPLKECLGTNLPTWSICVSTLTTRVCFQSGVFRESSQEDAAKEAKATSTPRKFR